MTATTKVAFIDQSGDAAGGAEESLLLLLRHLPKDIEPRVVVFDSGSFCERLRASGIDVDVVPLPKALLKTQRERIRGAAMLHVPLAVLTLAWHIRKIQADVVYTNTVKGALFGLPAARLMGKPSIAHIRDLLEGRARTLMRGVCALSGGKHIAITRAVDRWYGLKLTEVVDEPLDFTHYAPPMRCKVEARKRLGLPPDVPIVAMVGRINRWKGHDIFLKAAARIAVSDPRPHFVIVGAPIFRDADFADELKAMAGSPALASRVTFVPWTDDMLDVYAAIDIHCNCSTREPFGRTIIEAAAYGVPTVCFSDGGAPEAIEPGTTGIAVDPGDIEGLAKAISTYVCDYDRRRRDGEAGARFVKRFDAARHGERIAEIIRSVRPRR